MSNLAAAQLEPSTDGEMALPVPVAAAVAVAPVAEAKERQLEDVVAAAVAEIRDIRDLKAQLAELQPTIQRLQALVGEPLVVPTSVSAPNYGTVGGANSIELRSAVSPREEPSEAHYLLLLPEGKSTGDEVPLPVAAHQATVFGELESFKRKQDAAEAEPWHKRNAVALAVGAILAGFVAGTYAVGGYALKKLAEQTQRITDLGKIVSDQGVEIVKLQQAIAQEGHNATELFEKIDRLQIEVDGFSGEIVAAAAAANTAAEGARNATEAAEAATAQIPALSQRVDVLATELSVAKVDLVLNVTDAGGGLVTLAQGHGQPVAKVFGNVVTPPSPSPAPGALPSIKYISSTELVQDIPSAVFQDTGVTISPGSKVVQSAIVTIGNAFQNPDTIAALISNGFSEVSTGVYALPVTDNNVNGLVGTLQNINFTPDSLDGCTIDLSLTYEGTKTYDGGFAPISCPVSVQHMVPQVLPGLYSSIPLIGADRRLLQIDSPAPHTDASNPALRGTASTSYDSGNSLQALLLVVQWGLVKSGWMRPAPAAPVVLVPSISDEARQAQRLQLIVDGYEVKLAHITALNQGLTVKLDELSTKTADFGKMLSARPMASADHRAALNRQMKVLRVTVETYEALDEGLKQAIDQAKPFAVELDRTSHISFGYEKTLQKYRQPGYQGVFSEVLLTPDAGRDSTAVTVKAKELLQRAEALFEERDVQRHPKRLRKQPGATSSAVVPWLSNFFGWGAAPGSPESDMGASSP